MYLERIVYWFVRTGGCCLFFFLLFFLYMICDCNVNVVASFLHSGELSLDFLEDLVEPKEIKRGEENPKEDGDEEV